MGLKYLCTMRLFTHKEPSDFEHPEEGPRFIHCQHLCLGPMTSRAIHFSSFTSTSSSKFRHSSAWSTPHIICTTTMTVTKLPRTRNKGMLSQCPPPLSWPNDTAIGPRRPRLELLRQATRNRQQHRMSDLSASARRNIPNPAVQHPPLHSQAPRASGFSRHKAHKRTHHSTQRSNASNLSRKPSEQNEKLVVQNPSPDATRRPKASKVSSNSLTGKKGDAKSLKDDHMGKPSLLFPLLSLTHTSKIPPPTFETDTPTQRHPNP